jgi:type IV pilus assembly protein PilF
MNKVLGNSVKNLTLLSGILSIFLLVGCTTTTSTAKNTTTVNATNSKVQKKVHKAEVDKDRVLQNRLQLALGYMGKGDHESARTHLNKAMEVNSRSPEVHDVWGLLYQRESELEAAESHYKKALSYDPTFTRGRNNYGLFLLHLNRVEEAYQQFVAGSKDLGYPKRAELFYKVGITALKLNKVKEAEEAFTKAIVLNAKMSMAYLELAEITYERGDYSGAKALLSKYGSIKPNTSPRELWLGVKLEHSLGNQDGEASQGMALRNLFPDSRENKEYQSWLKNERKNQ